MAKVILCLNAGSSSLKFALYSIAENSAEKLGSGEVIDIGESNGRLRIRGGDGRVLTHRSGTFNGHAQASEAMFAGLKENGMNNFDAAGHRVVHGGPTIFDPQKVDPRLLARLRELVAFAPLHLPAQIAMIEDVASRHSGLSQAVCFDTAFHRNLPEVARRFALPRELWEKGIWRYGFHGLSYEFIVSSMGKRLGRRAIIAHLGNGASMVALKDGAAIDTSMGLTPAGGFMMGTRSGDLDPGILLYMLRQGWTLQEIADVIEHKSGLAGVSGSTNDMKTLLATRDADPRAAQAVEMFCYQAKKFVGAFAAALGGLDTLVFTGGIGERAAAIREGICRGLEFLGIELDPARNADHATVISAAGSSRLVYVMPTDEDLMIARHTYSLMSHSFRE